MIIPIEEYKRLARILPILCVDIIVRNPQNEHLLIMRANEPQKGRWWVLGGRVHKGETLERAARRKVREETGVRLKTLSPVGYYESVSEKNSWGGTERRHSVSIVFSAVMDGRQSIRLDGQSTDWKFSKKLPEKFHFIPFQIDARS